MRKLSEYGKSAPSFLERLLPLFKIYDGCRPVTLLMTEITSVDFSDGTIHLKGRLDTEEVELTVKRIDEIFFRVSPQRVVGVVNASHPDAGWHFLLIQPHNLIEVQRVLAEEAITSDFMVYE